jgi:hypothetical protein
MMKTATKPQTTPEQFVRAWQTSPTAEDAAKLLKVSVNGLQSRAKKYRERGINLKKFPPKQRVALPVDVDAMNALIVSLNGHA